MADYRTMTWGTLRRTARDVLGAAYVPTMKRDEVLRLLESRGLALSVSKGAAGGIPLPAETAPQVPHSPPRPLLPEPIITVQHEEPPRPPVPVYKPVANGLLAFFDEKMVPGRGYSLADLSKELGRTVTNTDFEALEAQGRAFLKNSGSRWVKRPIDGQVKPPEQVA